MKINKFYFIFLILIVSCNKDKKQTIDSNNKSLDSINLFLRDVNSVKIDTKTQYLNYKKALQVYSEQPNDSATRNRLFSITQGFYRLNKTKDFEKASTLLIEKSIKSKDSFNLAQGYRYKGNHLKNIFNSDSAFYYYFNSEKILKKLKEKEVLSNVLLNKSIIQYNIGDFVAADRSLTEAYENADVNKEFDKLYAILTMMGIVAVDAKDYDKAIEYFNRGLKIVDANQLKGSFQKETCLNNIGYVYQKKGDYKVAINYYYKALQNKNIVLYDQELYSLLIDNLAYSKFKVRDLNELPELFYTSLKVRENLQETSLIILSKIHISEYFIFKRDTLKSQMFAKEALDLAHSSKKTRDILVALKQMSNVGFKNSSKFSKDYIKISDSIQEVEKKSQEKFARLQLETDEIIQQNEGLAESNRNLLYVFVVSFILVVLLFVVRAQRARTRELLYKQAQQKANEDIYNLMMSQQAIIDESRNKEKKRLAQDLHDGVLGRMFGLRLNLDSLNSSTEEDAVQKRFELLNELKTIEQDIREISHDLNREKQVLINNFVSIVHNLLEEQKTSFEVNVNYTIDENVVWDKVSNAIKINLYRILQEGLQNINKYANAKNILVEIKGNEENVYLKIQDDGIGFDVNKKSKGIGMQNMISRTHDCKGIIDIASKKGNGTKILITIPIETKQPIIVEQE